MARKPIEIIPPNSREAEQSVLGAILLRPQVMDLVVGIVKPDDFYHHQELYRTMVDLYTRNKPVDLVTVNTLLKERGRLEAVGGPLFLTGLSEQVGIAANADYYAETVRDKAQLRRLLASSQDIATACLGPVENVTEFVNWAEHSLYEAAGHGQCSGLKDMKTLVPATYNRLEQIHKTHIVGTPTGFRGLDLKLHGFVPGDLIILAARPSMGKTALALNIATAIARGTDMVTPFFSLEMSQEQLMLRLTSAEAGVDGERLRLAFMDHGEWGKVAEAHGNLIDLPLLIDDTPDLTPMEIRGRCRRAARRGKLGLVVVDYLQLVRGSSKDRSREQEVAEVSRSLKALAKELHVPVLALAQLNRSCETRPDKRPIMADLRESGQIEQDADVVMFLYRHEVYYPNVDKGVAEVIIRKHRNGPIGTVKLAFDATTVRFHNFNSKEAP